MASQDPEPINNFTSWAAHLADTRANIFSSASFHCTRQIKQLLKLSCQVRCDGMGEEY